VRAVPHEGLDANHNGGEILVKGISGQKFAFQSLFSGIRRQRGLVGLVEAI
jgi:hypothetical protein